MCFFLFVSRNVANAVRCYAMPCHAIESFAHVQYIKCEYNLHEMAYGFGFGVGNRTITAHTNTQYRRSLLKKLILDMGNRLLKYIGY